jgi:ribosomal protein S18 acetylase RimI-like enzyme
VTASRALPDGWSLRRPTLDDLPDLLALVHASDVAAVGRADFSPEEVREALTGPNIDPSRDSWIATTPDGRIGAWTYLENETAGVREYLEVYSYPGVGEPAQAALLDLSLARIAERAREFGHPAMTARAGAIPNEEHYIGVLTAAGFTFIKRYARMRRSLDSSVLTPPALPAGVEIRLVRPDDDEDMRLFHRIYDTAFRDTPDYQPRSYDRWREYLTGVPTIAWDEWFVASVDGTPAGILMSSDQALDDNEGWVKNLAVLGAFRRRGAGEALLRRAFAVYAAKGRDKVGLGVDLENPTEAARLYHAVGMKPEYEADMFECHIPAAA